MRYWKQAQDMVAKAPSLAMATSNEDGSPNVSPIGSLFLTDEGRGFYFEKLPRTLRSNLDRDGRFAILCVRGGLVYWLKALFRGKFPTFPSLRLVGTAGKRRPCTPQEKALFDARFGRFKRMKGYDILWKNMIMVRDLTIQRVEPMNLVAMTEDLLENEHPQVAPQ